MMSRDVMAVLFSMSAASLATLFIVRVITGSLTVKPIASAGAHHHVGQE